MPKKNKSIKNVIDKTHIGYSIVYKNKMRKFLDTDEMRMFRYLKNHLFYNPGDPIIIQKLYND